MPVYNGQTYLKDAIDSVLSQSFGDFELLIINDGSTDDTERIIKSYSDERIKYFNFDHNGLVASLNFGLKNANGEFIARMDADDICLPERLEKQLKFFEHNYEYVLVGSRAVKIDQFGEVVGELDYPPLEWKDIKKYSLLHNPFIHPSIMFRKSILDIVGEYREFKGADDYEFWTRIIYKYPCANIAEPLLKYRIHTNQMTEKGNLEMRIGGVFVRIQAIFRFVFSTH